MNFINSCKRNTKNPLYWLIFIVIFLNFYRIINDKCPERIIYSDGRGYYAYLPSLLIFNDGSFKKSYKAEQNYHPNENPQLYLFKDRDNKIYNKYYPGIAILQIPFFLIAIFVSWLINSPITGYSDIFYYCFLIGSVIYSILGIYLFNKCLKLLFPNQKVNILIPLFFISTPLIYYTINTPCFSHHYSFFLFGVFTFLILKIKKHVKAKDLFLLGCVLGLIFLVRPTNITIILIIPFLLEEFNTCKKVFNVLFSKLKYLVFLFFGFVLFISIIFIIWKWGTDKWIIWNYNGEGFNLFHPEIFSCLFSFRIGLFTHSPILILSFVGLIYLFKENKFKAFSWFLYFILNCWIFSSWWCWDFLSSYGNRPYTEHLFFLLIPLFTLDRLYPKIFKFSLIIFSLIGSIRYYSSYNQKMIIQRFTKSNYIESLKVWKEENVDRWKYNKSAPPFGKIEKEILVISKKERIEINPSDEFSLTSLIELPRQRNNFRIYFEVKLQKKIKEKKLKDVFLVFDATSKDGKKRYYDAEELFEDRFEGKDNWANLEFNDQLYDNFNELDQIKIYFWNPGKQHIFLRKIEAKVFLYKS